MDTARREQLEDGPSRVLKLPSMGESRHPSAGRVVLTTQSTDVSKESDLKLQWLPQAAHHRLRCARRLTSFEPPAPTLRSVV